jgi:hypothetical protein
MPAPVIDTTQSVLGFLAGEEFAFQPFATNSPTGWSATGLPSGLTINTTTGLVEGSIDTPGVYVIGLYATNDIGGELVPPEFVSTYPEPTPATSAAAVFTIGIEEGTPTADAFTELVFDVATREVAGEFFAKRGDVLPVRVRFARGGAAVDLGTLVSLTLAVKRREPEQVLFEAADWDKTGTGADAVWDGAVDVSGALLDGALAEEESDEGTEFEGLAEIEVAWDDYKITSKTFPARIARDLVA